MARVRGFDRGTQQVRVHATGVDCFHQIVTNARGERYLHLSTFGSDSRQSAPKSSQSIQLDEGAARRLMQILREAFPGLSA